MYCFNMDLFQQIFVSNQRLSSALKDNASLGGVTVMEVLTVLAVLRKMRLDAIATASASVMMVISLCRKVAR